jgi:hypothetical protein
MLHRFPASAFFIEVRVQHQWLWSYLPTFYSAEKHRKLSAA